MVCAMVLVGVKLAKRVFGKFSPIATWLAFCALWGAQTQSALKTERFAARSNLHTPHALTPHTLASRPPRGADGSPLYFADR